MSEEAGNPNEGREWVEQLPEVMRAIPEVERAKSIEGLVDSLKATRDYVSNAIRVPTENAGEGDVAAFYEKLQKHAPNLMPTPDMANPDSITEALKRMGLPDAADGYEALEGDTLSFVDGQFDTLKQWALDAGLTRSQFKAFAEKVGLDTYNQQSEAQKALDAELKVISDEWGLSAEAKYKETLDFAKKSDAPESLVSLLENKQLDAKTVMWLNGMAQSMGETAQASNQDARTSSNGLTPYEATQQIREIQGNKEHPYYKGDPKARARMHELMRMAEPEKYAS